MVNPKKQRRWQRAKAIQKKHVINLPEGFRIIAEYSWLRGKITKFATVLIRPREGTDGNHMICRYDTAHHFAHLDLLNHQGKVVEKIAIPGNLKYKEAFLYAQDDLKKNYEWYWQKYLETSSESGR